MIRALDVVSSFAASTLQAGAGYAVGRLGPRPARRLELYEFEACPFCRKVRVALTNLDLEVMVFPCPAGGTRFRPVAREKGGKSQFPLLVDPNAGAVMYESDEIVRHLFGAYGDGRVPLSLSLGPVITAGSSLASAARLGRGGRVRPSRAPAQPLELWSYEVSPYSRIAREALCELEIPYVLHNVGKGSPGRAAFVARARRMMVPYLADPNTGREMFESAEIVRYLNDTYGA